MLGTCVLKMDHFCLWVVNTVGLLNYKFFLLFLIYTTLACIETLAVLLPVAIRGIASRGVDTSSRCAQLPRCRMSNEFRATEACHDKYHCRCLFY